MPPGFVVPLFVNTAPDNRLYVQQITQDDRIRSFEAIDIGDARVTPYDGGSIRAPGDLALWSFQFEDESCVVDIRPALRATLAKGESRFSPLLRLQIATLFEASDLAAHVGAAHRFLGQIAPRSADLWRDLVILLPRVRKTASGSLKHLDSRLHAAINAIDLETHGDTLRVTVPANLVENAGGESAFARSLSALKPIFAALGIVHLDIQQRSFEAPSGPLFRPSGLAIVHCLRESEAAPARKLRGVRHLVQPDIVDSQGVLNRAKLPDPREIVFLLVEDEPEQLRAAALIAQATAGLSSMTAALIVPRIFGKGRQQLHTPIRKTVQVSALGSHCRWVAFCGDVIDYDDDGYEPLGTNPHFDRQISDVARWTPHALRACLRAGQTGVSALHALSNATSESKSASIASAASRGKDAGAVAATAALTASRRTEHPAARAKLIVLVAFHNRAISAQTRDEIEHAARAHNPEAKILVVEEHREDMLKRVRVVAFSTGSRRVARDTYTPPARFMPLVRAGWKVGPSPPRSPWQAHTIIHGGHSYPLRFEPQLVVTEGNVDDIIRSTPMHHGEVALLVQTISDDPAVDRLLTSGIFCAEISSRQSFDRFGHHPGSAIRSAQAGLSRPLICERLSHLTRHFVLSALVDLMIRWQVDGKTYTHWVASGNESEPTLEQFEMYRVTQDGTCFFKGIIRLDAAETDVPKLRYAFGMALERTGVRLTRLKAVEGEYDVRAEARRRFDDRFDASHGRDHRKRVARSDTASAGADAQLELPGLSDPERSPDN
ncbi:hypothetical protein [Propylenella binzhouense]|uniref:Uncharacterized protein n=1 Tax=Propylenella binzhouense TaxID=2555902 RepID=A0A964WTD5_9HYPH|nr:hypothetical protein [Propylenella binzhouense]MYZ47883.1 hypothetical protein [Propylenella binzhouense]